MADVKILEKARTSFLQEDDLFFINQNNTLRQVPIKVVAEKTAGALPEATTDTAGTMTAQDKKNLTSLVEDHAQGITPAQKVDYARYTAVEVMNNLLTYIKQIPPGGCQKLNLGVGNTAAFVGYWNNNDDTTVLLAGAWSALEVIGVCFDSDQAYAKLRLTSYNSNKTYECTLKADVFTPWEVGGTVKSVNGMTPDSEGNIQVGGDTDIIKTVSGLTPDESGNIEVSTQNLGGVIKTINGIAPDSDGNINLKVERGKTPPPDTSKSVSFTNKTITQSSGIEFQMPDDGWIYIEGAGYAIVGDGIDMNYEQWGNIMNGEYRWLVVGKGDVVKPLGQFYTTGDYRTGGINYLRWYPFKSE